MRRHAKRVRQEPRRCFPPRCAENGMAGAVGRSFLHLVRALAATESRHCKRRHAQHRNKALLQIPWAACQSVACSSPQQLHRDINIGTSDSADIRRDSSCHFHTHGYSLKTRLPMRHLLFKSRQRVYRSGKFRFTYILPEWA